MNENSCVRVEWRKNKRKNRRERKIYRQKRGAVVVEDGIDSVRGSESERHEMNKHEKACNRRKRQKWQKWNFFSVTVERYLIEE